MIKLKLFLCIFLLSSNNLLAQMKSEDKTIDNIEKILGNKSAQAIIDKSKQDALNQASNLAVTQTKNYLDTLFPTVEVSLGLGDPGKPVGGVLVVAPISDPKNIYNTVFDLISKSKNFSLFVLLLETYTIGRVIAIVCIVTYLIVFTFFS